MSTYAISDLHGRYDLFEKMKNLLGPNDTIYCLGDCADRGDDGLKIIQEILADSRFHYLKGNHEDLLVKGLSEVVLEKYRGENYDLWMFNGGRDYLYCHHKAF